MDRMRGACDYLIEIDTRPPPNLIPNRSMCDVQRTPRKLLSTLSFTGALTADEVNLWLPAAADGIVRMGHIWNRAALTGHSKNLLRPTDHAAVR